MILTKLVPLEHHVLITKLSSLEVRKRIAGCIAPTKNEAISDSTKLYTGELSGDSFTISRIIHYRNAFLPVISGDIAGGFTSPTQVFLEMKLTRFFLVFIYSWIGVVGLVCVGILAAGLIQFRQVMQNGFSPLLLVPFGLFLLGCVLIIIPFRMESKKSKKFFDQLLDVQNDEAE